MAFFREFTNFTSPQFSPQEHSSFGQFHADRLTTWHLHLFLQKFRFRPIVFGILVIGLARNPFFPHLREKSRIVAFPIKDADPFRHAGAPHPHRRRPVFHASFAFAASVLFVFFSASTNRPDRITFDNVSDFTCNCFATSARLTPADSNTCACFNTSGIKTLAPPGSRRGIKRRRPSLPILFTACLTLIALTPNARTIST